MAFPSKKFISGEKKVDVSLQSACYTVQCLSFAAGSKEEMSQTWSASCYTTAASMEVLFNAEEALSVAIAQNVHTLAKQRMSKLLKTKGEDEGTQATHADGKA